MEAFQRSWLATCTVAGCTMWESHFEFFFALKVLRIDKYRIIVIALA